MNIKWGDVQLFLAVAETGSFSGAARALQLGQPTISRRIAQFEDRIGQALFHRGVDGAALTVAGHGMVPAARRMAESAGELSRMVAEGESAPTGRVRIAAPPGIAFDFLAPFAGYVRRRYPDLRVEVLAGIPHVDLVRHEADLAIRMRKPLQRELTCLCEIATPAVAYATAEYLATLPDPLRPADIDWIAWAPPYEQLPPNPQLTKLIDGFEPVFTSDSFLVQWRAAEAGVGAMFIGLSQHRFAKPTNLLPVPLSFDYVGRMYLVCAKTMRLVPRVQAVIGLLLEELMAAKGVTATLLA